MAGNALHLLVTIVAFSFLISFIDPPTTMAIRLVHAERQAIPSPEDTLQMNKAENHRETMEMVENEFFHSRMDFEINTDYYPGSGANNRHTPNPPVKD